MSEELQGLLNRIQSDGLKKSEEERDKIIAEAKQQAESMIAAAKAEAETIVRNARADAVSAEAKAKETIQQAARDVLIELKAELLRRMKNLVKESAGQAMTPALMADLVREMAKDFAANPDADKLELILPFKNIESMESQLKAALAADLQKNPEILPGRDFSAGLKIGFSGSDVFLDFIDEALADLICAYAGPKLAALLKS